MVCWNHGRLWSMKHVLIFVCYVWCTSENPLPVGEGVWSMCNTRKTGIHGAWLSTVAGQMLSGSDLGTKHVHYRWCVAYRRSAADVARVLDIHWVVHRIVWDKLDYREVCAHTARSVQSLFEEHEDALQHLLWLAQSPNLNIIEPPWSAVESRVRSRFPPSSLKQLEEEWYIIPLETNKNLQSQFQEG